VSFLLDTNVLSEGLRVRSDQRVDAFLMALRPEVQFISVLSVGEIRLGVQKLSSGKRKTKLEHWLDRDIVGGSAKQLLPVTVAVCERWAALRVQAGRSLPVIDSLIAATALHHGLTLATRNTKDFAGLGLKLVDPFA